ncbi:hypothetical protein TNCV_5096451 [Trichonephila clavipes]|nr:hypothetical protein TNCV_5096451 [Trichonephila clavipes]
MLKQVFGAAFPNLALAPLKPTITHSLTPQGELNHPKYFKSHEKSQRGGYCRKFSGEVGGSEREMGGCWPPTGCSSKLGRNRTKSHCLLHGAQSYG